MDPLTLHQPTPPFAVRREQFLTLWALTKTGHQLTAAIFATPLGHELRIWRGSDTDRLFDSLVAQDGDSALVVYANAVKSVFLADGWMDATTVTAPPAPAGTAPRPRPQTTTGDLLIVQRNGVAMYGSVLKDGDLTPHGLKTGTADDAIQWALSVTHGTTRRVFLDDGGGWRTIAEGGSLVR